MCISRRRSGVSEVDVQRYLASAHTEDESKETEDNNRWEVGEVLRTGSVLNNP